MIKSEDYYYNIENDIKAYPNAWCYLVVGGRNTGKTYSALKSCLLNDRPFVFLKRTKDDVDLLCSGSGRIGQKIDDFGIDLSPFKSINRDLCTDVRAFSIRKGLGGFWRCNDGEPEGKPIGYILALNAVSKYKGFDLSTNNPEQWLTFDEFIPQPWERVLTRREGEQLLDCYKTISRDREHRGLPALKLICLANATSISNQVFGILEVTDLVAQMQVQEKEFLYLDDRGILIHRIKDNPKFLEKEKESKLFTAMGDTAWGQMAFNNQFAYNDFSAIGRCSLKGYRPVCSCLFKHDNFYIYQKEGHYYMTKSAHDKKDNIYNLNQENGQKSFYYDYVIDLRSECIDGRMTFETYTMYDLIVNFKKHFSV